MTGTRGFSGRLRPVFLLCLILLLLASAAPGCSRVRPEETAEQFYASWGEQDYGAMYGLLDSASRSAYPEDHFRERYEEIGRITGLHGVVLKEVEQKDSAGDRAVFSLSVILETTTVGAIPVRYNVELSREKKGAPWLLSWNPGLIFPELDDDSRVDLVHENPQRGTILDRNGKTLAGPRVFRELGAVPGVYKDEKSFAGAVEALLGLSRETITGKLHQPWVREGLYVPLTVLAPTQEHLVERLLQIPGVMIVEVTRRYYPAGAAAAHLTGYLGEITAEELAERAVDGYREGDLLGKTGLEAALDRQLAGRKGYTLRILRAGGEEAALIATRELENGAEITLTIDLELQRFAAEALGEKRGAVVALDPRSGEILALYSNPGFDPNRFITGLTGKQWQELTEDPGQPLLNRALSGIYPPGSAFKPLTAAAAIDAGVLDPAEKVVIKGERWQPSTSWGGYHVRRVHPEVEQLDLNEAMKFSDNIYFARAGLALGGDKFIQYGRRFGFGEQIPFPLPAARSRLAPESGVLSEVQLADSSFGQGEVMITPLQMALLYSAFARGGSIPQPCLLLSDKPAVWKEKVAGEAAVQTVHRALVEVLQGARSPTAAGAIPGVKAAGKTGTAETGADGRNICWYVTYGPAEDPALVVAVMIEDGSWAATEALPVGRAVLQHYLLSGRS